MTNAIDFCYDGHYLSEFDMIICDFNATAGLQTAQGGSIHPITVKGYQKKKAHRVGTEYGEALSFTVQICKNPNDPYVKYKLNSDTPQYFTSDEYSKICGWLMRMDGFHRLTFLSLEKDSPVIHYDAVATEIDRLKIGSRVIGLEIKFETNAPFGYGNEIEKTFRATAESIALNTKEIIKFHDDIRTEAIPDLRIETRNNGYFSMRNLRNESHFYIKSCSVGEVFDFDGDMFTLVSSTRGNVCAETDYSKLSLTRNVFGDEDNTILIVTPAIVTFKYFPLKVDVNL